MTLRTRFAALSVAAAGDVWRRRFDEHWPGYRDWFLSEGDAARPSYRETLRHIEHHLPELVPTYEQLCALSGGGDLAARFLGMFRPPPYLQGCSQAVWSGQRHFLVRNYDYHPSRLEGTILHSCWNGRAVVAMVDCGWGVLDGINDAGLAVSLTFGGRPGVGDGFGVPIVLRYILEFGETVAEAVAILRRVPVHMSYNITVVDRSGEFQTVYLSPGKDVVVHKIPATTNHQGRVEWPQHAEATGSVARERVLIERLADSEQDPERFIAGFLHAPLYSTSYRRGFGTLYSAAYYPQQCAVDYFWPHLRWRQATGDFHEGTREIVYAS